MHKSCFESRVCQDQLAFEKQDDQDPHYFLICISADQESLSEGVNFDIVFFFLFFFLIDKGREDPNSTIRGPSLARQQNAIDMAFRWRAIDCS